jgi:hypothetical protein|tara:strand:- start:530 stop:946 length:417 start_codon:yes stop_codon:yes gene_type:complete
MFLSGKIKKESKKYTNDKLGISKGEKSNYLKGYFLLTKEFCKKYNITRMQLEILFRFYDENYFTMADLENLGFADKTRRFHIYNLRDSNLVMTFENKITRFHQLKKWTLTRKGKMLVKRFYRVLESIEDINSDYEELY